jgi:hypothetical protein
MNLIALYLIDLNGLTPKERRRLAAYAAVLFIPLATLFIALTWCVPGLEQVLHP